VRNRKQHIHNLICRAIKAECFVFSGHAMDQSTCRNFDQENIINSVLIGSVLEEQHDLNRAPRFIVCGRTKSGVRLETVWAYNERNGLATLISLFSPDKNGWCNSHIRRR
jgi:hypothetical protein